MPHSWWSASFFLVACFATNSFAAEKLSAWKTSIVEAEAFASNNDSPIVIHFHAPWCGPCKTMESTVLLQPAILELLQTAVIGVKVNSDQQRDLVTRYGVSTLPTDIFLDSRGQEVERTIGIQAISVYVSKLHSLVAVEASRAKTRKSLQTLSTLTKEERGKTSVEISEPLAKQPSIEPISPPIPQIARAPKKKPEKKAELVDLDKKALTSEVESDGLRGGLCGYSPVALAKENIWVKGVPEFSVQYNGVRYQFVSDEEAQLFDKNPEKFVPALHGIDPVAIKDKQKMSIGKLGWNLTFKQRLYFFNSKENRDAFQRNPDRYGQLNELRLVHKEIAIAANARSK